MLMSSFCMRIRACSAEGSGVGVEGVRDRTQAGRVLCSSAEGRNPYLGKINLLCP